MSDNDFEWSDEKAARNYAAHDLTFEVACEVFDDPFVIEERDNRGYYGEDRYNALGMVKGRLVIVTYTIRGTKIRLISARKAESHERRRYHEKIR